MSLEKYPQLKRVRSAFSNILEAVSNRNLFLNKEGFDELNDVIAQIIIEKDLQPLEQVEEKVLELERILIEKSWNPEDYDEELENMVLLTIARIGSIKNLLLCAINYVKNVKLKTR